jgi:hypothetical protein
LLKWRNLVCGVMIAIFPSSLIAQDATRGLLHSQGGTWLNDSPAPPTAAIFPDSLVQTQKGYTARIDVEGSGVVIAPETVVQFQGLELALDHGHLQLDTASEMKVLIGCITVTPITYDRTQYDVTDVDGKVKVVAYKNDVKIELHGSALQQSKNGRSSSQIVREGEQATRSEHCGAAIEPTQGGTKGALLDNPWAKGAGLVAIGLTCLIICRGDDPISPSTP